jgi:hypothetical protein
VKSRRFNSLRRIELDASALVNCTVARISQALARKGGSAQGETKPQPLSREPADVLKPGRNLSHDYNLLWDVILDEIKHFCPEIDVEKASWVR